MKAGDWQGASQRLQEYNKAGGQVNPGLVSRRQKEAAWFNAEPSAGSPVAQMPMNLGQGTAPAAPPKPYAMPSFFGMQGQLQQQPAQEQQAQADPSLLGGPPQLSAMQPLGGAPRRPADFSRLRAMLQQARTARA